ncbi:MAG: hypothetical protein AABX54_01065 [Nanoarchaeota archaeon]
MEIDHIIKDLGAGALVLRPQETYSCAQNNLHPLKYRHMGLLVILVLVLILAIQNSFVWPSIVSSILAITAMNPSVTILRKEK